MQLAHARMNEWHRLYGELGAAQQRLSIAGRCGASDENARAMLQLQVTRLQRQSEAALRALQAAVASSNPPARR
jgi:hypothetical protein